MRYVELGSSFDVKFTTRRFSSGAPFTLAGSPVVSAYPDNSTTQLTAGLTLTVDFDSVTGLNNVRVVATSGNGYAAGNWALVITTGTVDSVSVVGETIENFVIGAIPASLSAAGLATDAVDEIADGVLNRNLATGTDAGTDTIRTVRQALRFLRNKWSIAGSTLTVTKEDDTTASWTAALTTTTGANPVTASDPAGP